MLGACREYKNIFKEMRGRASKALAFARMLHKDLGIANKYKMNCTTDALFKMLKESKHFKVKKCFDKLLTCILYFIFKATLHLVKLTYLYLNL